MRKTPSIMDGGGDLSFVWEDEITCDHLNHLEGGDNKRIKMECEYCGSELKHHDNLYTGNHAAYEKGYENSGYKVIADIYQCFNEECENLRESITVYR